MAAAITRPRRTTYKAVAAECNDIKEKWTVDSSRCNTGVKEEEGRKRMKGGRERKKRRKEGEAEKSLMYTFLF